VSCGHREPTAGSQKSKPTAGTQKSKPTAGIQKSSPQQALKRARPQQALKRASPQQALKRASPQQALKRASPQQALKRASLQYYYWLNGGPTAGKRPRHQKQTTTRASNKGSRWGVAHRHVISHALVTHGLQSQTPGGDNWLRIVTDTWW
jgi:hypothetical protein